MIRGRNAISFKSSIKVVATRSDGRSRVRTQNNAVVKARRLRRLGFSDRFIERSELAARQVTSRTEKLGGLLLVMAMEARWISRTKAVAAMLLPFFSNQKFRIACLKTLLVLLSRHGISSILARTRDEKN